MCYILLTVFSLDNIEKYQIPKYSVCGTDFNVPKANLNFTRSVLYYAGKKLRNVRACKIYTLSIVQMYLSLRSKVITYIYPSIIYKNLFKLVTPHGGAEVAQSV